MLDLNENPQYETYDVNKGTPIPGSVYVMPITVCIGLLYNHFFIYGGCILLVIVTLMSVRNGTEVNITASQYRDYFKVFFRKFGTWKRLGEHDYVLVSKTLKRQAVTINFAMSTSTETLLYDVDLITKGNRDVILNRCTSRDKAVAFAYKFAELHKLKISERVNNGYVWP